MDWTYDTSPSSMYEMYRSYKLEVPGWAIYNIDIVLRRNLLIWLRHATAETLQTVHTLIEYMFNYIRFTINNPDQFVSPSRSYLNSIHPQIKLLEQRLVSVPFLSEPTVARAQRLEAIYQDLVAGLEEARQRSVIAASRTDLALETRSALPEPWLPSIRSRETFSSEGEENFMTQLRHLHDNDYTFSSMSLWNQLVQLCCEEFPNNNTVLSEASTDTAMRLILHLLRNLSEFHPFNEVDNSDILLPRLYSAIDSINRPENLRQRELDCNVYRAHVEFRQTMLRHGLFQRERPVEDTTLVIDEDIPVFFDDDSPSSPITIGPMYEATPGMPPSALWRRLLVSRPANVPKEEYEADKCSVCFNDNVNQINYAILDKCVHRFCVECISQWFVNRSSCPNCRSQTTSWTTRDHLALALEEFQ